MPKQNKLTDPDPSNKLEDWLAANAPGYTPPMAAAPTVSSTGGITGVVTPAGQVLAQGTLDALMYPGRVATGQAQVFDPNGGLTQEATDWGAGTALGMVGGSSIPRTPVAAGEAALGSGPIRAYHGSPHDFDRFDLSKIGTGEGAQAYGHGLYFAENEGVAKSYRELLSKYKPEIDGVPIIEAAADGSLAGRLSKAADLSRPESITAAKLVSESVRTGQPLDELIRARAAQHRELYGPGGDAEILALGGKLAPVAPKSQPGRMYEVAIHADPERFLNYDVPMSQQSQSVQKALKDLPEYRAGYDLSARIGMPRGDEAGYGIADTVGMGARVTGRAPDGVRRDVVASQLMNEAGIPGIRYLDQGSRGVGDGSRNIVTFNDKIVEIMRKYGVASFAALPPAVQMMLQHGAEPTGNKLTAEPAS